VHVNKIIDSAYDATFHQLTKPTLSIQRKYLEKIEREIGLRKWSKVESTPNEAALQKQGSKNEDLDHTEKCITKTKVPKPQDTVSSGKKTMDLFNKARDALNNPQSHEYTNNIMTNVRKEQIKVREILPMQKRGGLWRKPEQQKPEDTDQEVKSPKSNKSKESLKAKVVIPFSKNRYCNDTKNPEILHQNKKNAVKFLKNQKEQKKHKEIERRKLIEKGRKYTERVRKFNKEKLTKKRKRTNSVEGQDSDVKDIYNSTAAIRSKSHEVKARSNKPIRKYARNRSIKFHRSEIKGNDSSVNNKYIKTISAEDEPQMNYISKYLPPRLDNKVSINVDLVAKLNQNHKEILELNQIDNSEQINSIEEDDTKYMKTPELNDSDQKVSEQSTEKEESKRTKRCHSSQKKKSIIVAQEIRECKRDLIKMQRINEVRKRRVTDENEQQ
jgi:hypothetical protein